MMKYKLKIDRVIRDCLYGNKGDIVYDCKGHDYGCANDDTRFYGYDHKSVTLNENGDYPFFTVPVTALEKLE